MTVKVVLVEANMGGIDARVVSGGGMIEIGMNQVRTSIRGKRYCQFRFRKVNNCLTVIWNEMLGRMRAEVGRRRRVSWGRGRVTD